MIKKFMIMIVAAMIAACGGGDFSSPSHQSASGGGEGRLSTGSLAEGEGAVQVSSSSSADLPLGKMIRDRRFDEKGRIIGVYAVPYNPCDHKPCEKK